MKRFAAILLGLILVSAIPIAGMAEGKAQREEEMTRTVRSILRTTREPARVARLLDRQGARFLGYQASTVTFVYNGETVLPARSTVTTVGPGLDAKSTTTAMPGDVHISAGEKADLTLTLWLYEWRNRDGSYSEQAVISGYWSETEYTWIDDPQDVIDIRWIVGDLVYLSSQPFDGVERDQHTQGIASFTVPDQVANWDLFVNFKPVSSTVHGRWTNIFANYTHTWWGVRLGVTLGAGPNGSTGTIVVSTDGKTWTEGTGLAFRIGSGETRGPVTTGLSGPGEQR